VAEAYEINKENGDDRWAQSIQKEMNAVRMAFHILEDGVDPPPGYQYMDCHLVFDVKFDGFRFKSRMKPLLQPTPILLLKTRPSVPLKATVRLLLLPVRMTQTAAAATARTSVLKDRSHR
jgi:hypothetical protein